MGQIYFGDFESGWVKIQSALTVNQCSFKHSSRRHEQIADLAQRHRRCGTGMIYPKLRHRVNQKLIIYSSDQDSTLSQHKIC